MNETLKQLMLEAGYAAPELAGRAHKLAKLIVEECAKLANEETSLPYNSYSKKIKGHFGVEE